MSVTEQDIDDVDALIREGFPHTRFLGVPSWLGKARLARWAPDGSDVQVDHLSEGEAIAVSVRTVYGWDSDRVLDRMSRQENLQRGHTGYSESWVGVRDASQGVTISVDGQSVEARRWGDEGAWWLAADLEQHIALVVHGVAHAPVVSELCTVSDVEPLLAARRAYLLRAES